MQFMRGLPDKAYELAIVDPEYGINIGNAGTYQNTSKTVHKKKSWDLERPSANYFKELRRVSENQVIWGGNYFADLLPPSRGWVYWDKMQTIDNYASGELAWTSFDRNLICIKVRHAGFLNPDKLDGSKAIHPTQKSVMLYKKTIAHFASPGDKILDTHGGSMSIAIACYDLGFDLDLCELDKDYFLAGQNRLDNHIAKYAPASERPVTNKGELKLF